MYIQTVKHIADITANITAAIFAFSFILILL